MTHSIEGLHHVTAITGDAQNNITFYCEVLGLRLIKATVNFDDPTSYHLYYGDEKGSPGTAMTFFVWPEGNKGVKGTSQANSIAFSVPRGSLSWWENRLGKKFNISLNKVERFSSEFLCLDDPDGISIELAEGEQFTGVTPLKGPVPPEHAIRGFYSVTLHTARPDHTRSLLMTHMNYEEAGNEKNRFRLAAKDKKNFVEIVDVSLTHGQMGAGVVHHVAFRTPDDQNQLNMRAQLLDQHFQVSPVMDRSYFHSIYFREPGGVLFEVATDGPGFATDETEDCLGTSVKFPKHVAHRQSELESVLPALALPTW